MSPTRDTAASEDIQDKRVRDLDNPCCTLEELHHCVEQPSAAGRVRYSAQRRLHPAAARGNGQIVRATPGSWAGPCSVEGYAALTEQSLQARSRLA